MQLLETYPRCSECLIGLARDAALLSDGKDPGLQAEAEAIARNILEESRDRGLSSPEVANKILRRIRDMSGVTDPYLRFKAREMAASREVASPLAADTGPGLRPRVALAALGNSLDFFNTPEEALARSPEDIRRGISYFRDDVDRLEAFLAGRPALVLYLTDNSGEIYFDLPLYEYVRERAARTVLVVKGGPALNDLTRNDLERAGLLERFDEVRDTGTDGAGIDWPRVSEGFSELLEGADLVISKGMANFETVYMRDMSPAVFFIMKVKCQPIQDYLSVPVGNFMALWREGNPVKRSGEPGAS